MERSVQVARGEGGAAHDRRGRRGEAAEEAGLRYVSDSTPGIRRRRRGRGFSYTDTGGRTVTDDRERERIRSLAVPPAWTDVWICADPRGHLQATGRDARGRKQFGDTRAVCRSCYLHPAVPAAHLEGDLAGHWERSRASRWYRRGERATLSLLEAAASPR